MPVSTCVSSRHSGFLKRYSAKLFCDNTVFVQGITESERKEAPVSYLCGLLEFKVNRHIIPIKSLVVRFMGESKDLKPVRVGGMLSLIRVEKTIIDDSWVHETEGACLQKGTYRLPFRFMIHPGIPESVNCFIGQKSYFVEVLVNEEKRSPLILFRRDIVIIRRPAEGSTLDTGVFEVFQKIESYVECAIMVSPRLVRLNENLNILINIHKPEGFPEGKTLKLTRIDFMIVQKMITPGLLYELNSKSPKYNLRRMKCLRYKPIEVQGDGIIETHQIKLCEPPIQGITPYTSNNGDFHQQEDCDEMTLTHQMKVSCFFHVHDKSEGKHALPLSKLRLARYQVSLTSRIYILHPKVGEYQQPPLYSVEDKELSITRSSVWCHTNGRCENDFSPAYSSKASKGKRYL